MRFREQSIAAADCAVGRRHARDVRRAEAAGPRERHRARRARRDQFASGVSRRRRARLSRARSLGADAVGRRSAAHPSRCAARLESAGRVLHPRRADHRSASARQPHPARYARSARGEGQFAARRRARRGHDPARRPRRRSRARRRHARRSTSSPPARREQLRALAGVVTGRLLANPLQHPLGARRAYRPRRRRSSSAARRCTTCASRRFACRSAGSSS